MKKIALLVSNEQNKKLMTDMLNDRYEILASAPEDSLSKQFDLAIVDGVSLDLLQVKIKLLKYESNPVFLPFLFITTRQDIGYTTRYLWKVIDDIIVTPIEKIELLARIEMLLMTRRYSVEIKNRLEEMEILAHAIGHDLRAPLRTIETFASYLKQDCYELLSDTHKDYLERILRAITKMNDMQDTIHTFMTVGCKGIVKQTLSLKYLVRAVLEENDIILDKTGATVTVLQDIQFSTDEKLIKIILKNLIENGVKFVESGKKPFIEINGLRRGEYTIIEVSDNGIGIPDTKIDEIFKPFYRLHADKEYPGTGLGLTIVKKCVDMLAGSIKVVSKDSGTTFILEFLERR